MSDRSRRKTKLMGIMLVRSDKYSEFSAARIFNKGPFVDMAGDMCMCGAFFLFDACVVAMAWRYHSNVYEYFHPPPPPPPPTPWYTQATKLAWEVFIVFMNGE